MWIAYRGRDAGHPAPPGSRAGLLLPSPLSMAQATFTACRSSLANVLLRTRFHHVQPFARDLCVAIWVEPYTGFGPVRAAIRAPHEVMAMPARQLCDTLVADQTEPV